MEMRKKKTQNYTTHIYGVLDFENFSQPPCDSTIRNLIYRYRYNCRIFQNEMTLCNNYVFKHKVL